MLSVKEAALIGLEATLRDIQSRIKELKGERDQQQPRKTTTGGPKPEEWRDWLEGRLDSMPSRTHKPGRHMSASARRRISRRQKERWRNMSEAQREHISQAHKASWRRRHSK